MRRLLLFYANAALIACERWHGTSSETTLVPKSLETTGLKRTSGDTVDRPPIAHVLYRQFHHPHVKSENPGMHNNDIGGARHVSDQPVHRTLSIPTDNSTILVSSQRILARTTTTSGGATQRVGQARSPNAFILYRQFRFCCLKPKEP